MSDAVSIEKHDGGSYWLHLSVTGYGHSKVLIEERERLCGELDATPNDDLRELVQKWQNFEADIEGAPWLNRAADELERLIGESRA